MKGSLDLTIGYQLKGESPIQAIGIIHKFPSQGVNIQITDKISSVFTRIQYPCKEDRHSCRYSHDLWQPQEVSPSLSAGKDYPTIEDCIQFSNISPKNSVVNDLTRLW